MAETDPYRQPVPWWASRNGEPGPAMDDCLAAAVAAPSVHNTQPWKFRPRVDGVDLYADFKRQLPVIDPAGRELTISAGAALFNLRVAILAHGHTAIQRLIPVPAMRDLLARVTIGRPTTVSATVRALSWAIPRRHSNRWPFTEVVPAADLLIELAEAARAEGATLRIPGTTRRHSIIGLIAAAERYWREDPAYRAELAEWTHDQSGRRDGVPAAAFGPWSASREVPVRDLGLTQLARGRYLTDFEPTPTIAVLYGAESPREWLRAGQALQRVLLTATLHGLAATLMTQPTEIPELRRLLADPFTEHPAQVIIRLGYGRRPGRTTPRRPVTDALAIRPV